MHTLKALFVSAGIAMAAPLICSCMILDWSAPGGSRLHSDNQHEGMMNSDFICKWEWVFITYTYRYLDLISVSTCFLVQRHSGNTKKLSSPWKKGMHTETHKMVRQLQILQWKSESPVLLLYQDASNERSSIPCCNMGLKRRVRGKGTLAVWKQKHTEKTALWKHTDI